MKISLYLKKIKWNALCNKNGHLERFCFHKKRETKPEHSHQINPEHSQERSLRVKKKNVYIAKEWVT